VTAEFANQTENSALKNAIVEKIGRDGPMSFHDFMETVLYHPTLGYYSGDRVQIGREGDYLTSPEVSPLFGAMVGRQLLEMWELMGRPATFDAVEAGAGNGTLARDILGWARRTAPDFAKAVRYAVIEVSQSLVRRQTQSLEAEGLAGEVRWLREPPSGVRGCVFANELLDAMPVHRVRVRDGRLSEIHVTWDGERFGETEMAADGRLAEYFERLSLLPGDESLAEVNSGAPLWTNSAATGIERGFLLLFDYGYEAEELYAPWRKDGTLMCFYRHNPSTDPYTRIGRQDMTSHVDFTTIRRTGEEAGLTTLGLLSQSEFLANLGIGDALATPDGGEIEEYFARRRAVMELLDPGGLGRIKALVQGRGVDGALLRGLAGGV